MLNNGRLLEHFHEGNLTYRSPGIKEKTPDTFVEVSPELARGARHPERKPGPTDLAPRPPARAGRGHRPRAQRRTLHAHELRREPGQCFDRQPHRPGDAYARLQGDRREACRC